MLDNAIQIISESAPTISDKGSACEHFAEHELDHSQDDAQQATDDGHTEQEPILRERDRSTERSWEIFRLHEKC